MSNPQDNAIDFVLDLETSRLPSGIGHSSIRETDGSIQHSGRINIDRESQVIPHEIAILNKDTDRIRINTISGVRSPKHDINVSSETSTMRMFLGEQQEARVLFGTIQNQKDIEDLFKRPNSKGKMLSQGQIEHYNRRVHPSIRTRFNKPDVFFEFNTPNGKYITSKFSARYTEKPSSILHQQSVESVTSFVKGIHKKSGVMTLDEFESKFVNEFASTIIDAANKKGAVNIGAWNAQFESDRIAAYIYKYADKDTIAKWNALVNDRKVKFISMETSYMDVTYGLSLENKALMDSMTIPIRPDTYHEFASRVGRTPRTYKEFTASVPWKQEFVTSITEDWLTGLESMKGIEAHGAGVDVVRADKLHDFFSKVQKEAARLLEEGGYEAGNFHSALKKAADDGRNTMHQAFKNVFLREKGKTVKEGVSASQALASFEASITKGVLGRTTSTRELLKEIMRTGGPTGPTGGGIRNYFKNMSSGNKYGYGILATAAGIAIASTYISKGDKDDGLGGALGKIGKLKYKRDNFDSIDTSLNGPITHTSYSDLAFNATGVFLGISLVGYRSAMMRANLFGANRGFELGETPVRNIAKQAGRLFRHGVRTIEDYFPVSRVFKFGSALDFVLGDYKEGRKLFAPFMSKYSESRVGRIDTNVFMEAMDKANPEQASLLRERMSIITNNDFDGISEASLVLKRKGKQTLANIQLKDINGNSGYHFDDDLVFDVDSTFIKTRRANSKGRGVHPSDRKVNDAYSSIKSSVAETYIEKEDYRLGNITRKSYNKFIQQFEKPDYLNGTLWKGYKWIQNFLEIGPKGINQSENIFYDQTRALGGVKAVVGVRGVGGAASKVDSLKYKGGFASTFAREFIQGGNRFLESPFELFIDPVKINRFIKSMTSSKSTGKQILGKVLQKIEHPHLGLNINTMKYGIPEYFAKFAAKRVLPLGLAYYGVKTLDSTMGALTFSPTGRGPLTALPNAMYQKAALAYSKMSDILGLTTVAKNQQNSAPGSTGLGIFVVPASLAGTYAIWEGMYNRSPRHTQNILKNFGKSIASNNFSRYSRGNLAAEVAKTFSSSALFQEAMKKEAFKGALGKSLGARAIESFVHAPKKSLFAVGMGLILPFLPGFIGSTKSYQERKAEFAGQKDVAIRKNRGWLLSNQAFEGGAIQQYRQHGSFIYNSNYENRGVIWPSYSSRLLHAATLGLANRYVLEEYHKEDQPVYETAPYGASVPLVGPLISKTIGWAMKPVVKMHEEISTGSYRDSSYSPSYQSIAKQGVIDKGNPDSPYFSVLNAPIPKGAEVRSKASFKQAKNQFMLQLNDLIGFKGFALRSFMDGITGNQGQDEYTPYLKSAQEMYNPSQFMWQYQGGDVTLVGGEFLRRAFVDRRKLWEINNIPNSLYGQDWIPKRFQTGTTFDKMPMGWLYASKKGWEFQYPEIKGLNPAEYPDNIKLDILKYMAPHSKEFSMMSQRVNQLAQGGQLTPFEEQRAYDAQEQASRLKDKVYAHNQENARNIELDNIEGTIKSLDLSRSTFTLEGSNIEYRLAGVSTNKNDIRSKLLKENKYDDADSLTDDANNSYDRLMNIIEKRLKVGSKVSFQTATFSSEQPEALISGLNEKLIRNGSPLVNTGNVSQYTLAQEMAPLGNTTLGKYWNALTAHNSMFGNKLMGNKDYLSKYKTERVYNRQVKLWTKPISHFLQPFIASALHHYGVDSVPSFTKEVRATEQYWDVIKYIKYKKLQKTAHNRDDAEFYRQMAEKTSVGIDPINNSEEVQFALPYGERDYFNYFANEPDSAKRGKIRELIPKGQRRIYDAIWTANLARSGAASNDIKEKYQMLEATGGYDVDSDVLEDFQKDTGGKGDLKEYVRARYVAEFAKNNNLPGENWLGWNSEVNIDNTEIHSLLEQGQQTQDYGYFEEAKRNAAYDKGAYIAAQQIHSSRLTESQFTGTILPVLVSGNPISDATSIPTQSVYPTTSSDIRTDSYSRQVYANHNMPGYASGTMHNSFQTMQ